MYKLKYISLCAHLPSCLILGTSKLHLGSYLGSYLDIQKDLMTTS
jgi:hypothetical protein